ncbi:hypothetical protein [Ruminiclostridium cellobioparum]|jgi:trans-2-enoyl-CoA reductase|uniref:Uncharacterized protein n=1 Tax=Ruminiclostridium cellobioparum subsp. termitidis CT1112 TaxID=1195236 RepID=S0FTU9_RUMCE|nr:hypothetical protein [Ruminiclostridium cellobioparum]EMS73756.1 hypothetical protein CTER_0293 [Ruminiclostridium cellobioparum subsp. termitidis CT1112]
MEDKMFELVTKMYDEFSEFRKDMNEFRKETKKEIRGLKNDVIRFENKLDAVFDGYKQTFEKLTVVEKKVDDLSAKVEKQDVEITVIKGGKKTKSK